MIASSSITLGRQIITKTERSMMTRPSPLQTQVGNKSEGVSSMMRIDLNEKKTTKTSTVTLMQVESQPSTTTNSLSVMTSDSSSIVDSQSSTNYDSSSTKKSTSNMSSTIIDNTSSIGRITRNGACEKKIFSIKYMNSLIVIMVICFTL